MESKKEEANYHSQISSLKWNKKSSRGAFTDGKSSNKSYKIYFKILRHQERRGWCFCKQAKIENGNSDKVSGKGPTKTVSLYRFNWLAVTFIGENARRTVQITSLKWSN